MEKQYAIISHDRHRDDYVYLVKCEEQDVKNYVEKIWKEDFHCDAPYKSNLQFTDGSGGYTVEVAILKEIK